MKPIAVAQHVARGYHGAPVLLTGGEFLLSHYVYHHTAQSESTFRRIDLDHHLLSGDVAETLLMNCLPAAASQKKHQDTK